MLRAKDAITALPSTAGDVDYETGGSVDFFGDEGGTTRKMFSFVSREDTEIIILGDGRVVDDRKAIQSNNFIQNPDLFGELAKGQSPKLTCLLSEIGLDIKEAHVFSTTDGYSLDVFVFDGWEYEMKSWSNKHASPTELGNTGDMLMPYQVNIPLMCGDSEEEPLDIGGEVGSSSRSGMPSWAFSKYCDEHYFKTILIQLINQTNSALQTTTNANKKLLQANLASLQLQQIQGFQHARDVNTIKGNIDEMKKAISDKMDSKLPEAAMLDIKRQLRKNSDLATKMDALDTRMSAMEASLTAIHPHQAQQTDLLQKLVAAQTSSSPQLDDNKKWEKGPSEGEKLHIQISKVIVPTIAFTKPPLTDSIDLINEAAASLRAAEREQLKPINWEKIDEDIQKKFGLVKKP
ncbi:hypothetical protein AgCh_020652 [Apium graveolens]